MNVRSLVLTVAVVVACFSTLGGCYARVGPDPHAGGGYHEDHHEDHHDDHHDEHR